MKPAILALGKAEVLFTNSDAENVLCVAAGGTPLMLKPKGFLNFL